MEYINQQTEDEVGEELNESSKPLSKVKLFIKYYLDPSGNSSFITRYDLPHPLSYTSGDGIFRSDGPLGKKYKFARFTISLENTLRKTSRCWKLTPEDLEMIRDEHSKLTFPSPGDPEYVTGFSVYFIKFYGKGDEIIDQGIRKDILEEIKKRPCVNCGTKTQIECDHKNDLKNDPRVLVKETQTMEDFQPLCKHCNDVKRAVKARMMREGKRIGASVLGFSFDFTYGDETLDVNDPYWFVGTYWGDCAAFKNKLCCNVEHEIASDNEKSVMQ